MAYKEIGDVETVTLGGSSKNGVRNPTSLEGFFIRVEQREDTKFKKGLQPYYVFLTENGEKGVYGKTHLNNKMKSAVLGAKTLVTATDEVMDTGKGNPMKLFKVKQDLTNTIDVSALSTSSNEVDTSSDSSDDTSLEEEVIDLEEEEAPPVQRAPLTRGTSSSIPSDRIAKAQAMLAASKLKSKVG